MIARFIWWVGLAAIAVLTTLLQFDIGSRSNDSLASVVPSGLRGYAQAGMVQKALAGDDAALAVTEAKALVRRRPLPAENLTLLATAHAKAGQIDAAGTAIQIAGQRGWRDPAAQEAVLRLALAAGDEAEAARRYASLFLRNRTPDALLLDLGPAVLDDAGGIGQRTLVAIVVGGERWHDQFLRRGQRVMPPAAFSAIAAESLAKGAAFDCNVLGQAVRGLRQRDAAAAETLRSAAAGRCPRLSA